MQLPRLRTLCRESLKAFSPRRSLPFLGSYAEVVFEARHAWPERDYETLRSLARGTSCVFDIGANKGITGLIMLDQMEPEGILVAFEPSSEACRILAGNMAANDLSGRVMIAEAFVSDRSGRLVRFETSSASVHNAELTESRPGDGVSNFLKPTITIDDFIADHSLVPAFVKIDVEGAERQVLEGMKHCLEFQRPTVFVEVHELSSLSVLEHGVLISDAAKQLGYRIVSTATGFDFDAKEFENAKTRAHLLLSPEERPIPRFPTIPLP